MPPEARQVDQKPPRAELNAEGRDEHARWDETKAAGSQTIAPGMYGSGEGGSEARHHELSDESIDKNETRKSLIDGNAGGLESGADNNDENEDKNIIIRDYAYSPADDRYRGILPQLTYHYDTSEERRGEGNGMDNGFLNSGRSEDDHFTGTYGSHLRQLDWSGELHGEGYSARNRHEGDLVDATDEWEDYNEAEGTTQSAAHGLASADTSDASGTPPTFHPEEDPVLAGAYVALYDFPPENDHELGMKEGDEVRVHYRLCDGWVVASMVKSSSSLESSLMEADKDEEGRLNALGGRRNSHDLLSGIVPENYIHRLKASSGSQSLAHSGSGHWSPDVRQKTRDSPQKSLSPIEDDATKVGSCLASEAMAR